LTRREIAARARLPQQVWALSFTRREIAARARLPQQVWALSFTRREIAARCASHKRLLPATNQDLRWEGLGFAVFSSDHADPAMAEYRALHHESS